MHPVYSHNPMTASSFPLLILDVCKGRCAPFNEGFGVLHWHEEIQFIRLIKGMLRCHINTDTFTLTAGQGLFINQHTLHQLLPSADAAYRSFIIPPKMLTFFPESAMTADVYAITDSPDYPYTCFDPETPEALPILDALAALDASRQADTSYHHYRQAVCLCQLWLAFLESGLARPHPCDPRQHARIRAMLDFIHQHYQEPVTLAQIADAAFVSQTECLRCFKAYSGTSPGQYLLHYRLNAAATALRETDQTVTAIALQNGFASLGYFIRRFKSAYGLTPVQYRRQSS